MEIDNGKMKINFPQYKFRTRQWEKGLLVFDRLRNKFVPLTPEEAVRQNFVEYLISEKQYPAGLMNNEVAIL